jgi:hypothetical protein
VSIRSLTLAALCRATALALVTGSAASGAAAQQRTPARPVAPPPPAPGEAVTPQLVTVRPRVPLRFDAQLVVPTFYDRNFWPSILAGLDVAPTPAAPVVGGDAASANGPAVPRPTQPAAPRRPVRPAPRAPR